MAEQRIVIDAAQGGAAEAGTILRLNPDQLGLSPRSPPMAWKDHLLRVPPIAFA